MSKIFLWELFLQKKKDAKEEGRGRRGRKERGGRKRKRKKKKRKEKRKRKQGTCIMFCKTKSRKRVLLREFFLQKIKRMDL